MKKVIRENYHWILLIMFILFMFWLHQYIYLAGDDFIYGIYAKDGISTFINNHINHYRVVNGRAIVHFMVTIFLLFDIHLWRIVNPILIGILIVLISKITSNTKEEFKRGVILGIILISIISIDISRETIFWLDGSFNYFYPMILFLLNIYLFKNMLDKEKKYILTPLVGFLSGATVEQAGLMTIGVLFLIIIDRVIIKKRKIPKIAYVNFIATIIGYLTVVLSPGNRVRASKNSVNIFYNIIELFRLNFMSDGIEVYILLLMSACILWLLYFININYRKKFNKILLNLMITNFCVYSAISCFTKYITFIANKMISNEIIVTDSLYDLTSLILELIYGINKNNLFGTIIYFVAILSGIFTVAVLIYLGIALYTQKSEYILFVFSIVYIGAQLMMTISPVFGYRTVLPSIISLFVIIIYSILNNWDNKYLTLLGGVISVLSTHSIYLLIFFIILSIALAKNKKLFKLTVRIATIFLVSLLTLNAIKNNFEGYKKNSVINEYNLNSIDKFKNQNNSKELILKKLIDDKYGYLMIYESEYHVKYFKIYYDLPENINIIFEEY